MKRVVLATLTLLVAACMNLFAQYGTILHTASREDRLTIGSSILLVGVAAGSLRPEIGVAEARSTLQKLGMRLPSAPDGEPVTYGGYAFLLTQLFDLRGSLAYGLFPGPRSAFDELQTRGLIPRRERSGHFLSGGDALLLLRRIVEERGPSR
jgi:hypothetical protein